MLDSDAHAWTEIFINGGGWYPVDMTPDADSPLPGQGSAAVEEEATPTDAGGESSEQPQEMAQAMPECFEYMRRYLSLWLLC